MRTGEPSVDDVARLIAIDQIRNLKSRYFRFMDLRDFDAMAAVFCRDAIFDASEASRVLAVGGDWIGAAGPIVRGREAIIAWVRQSFGNSTSVHRGYGHEVTIESATEAHGVIAMEDQIFTLDRQTRRLHAGGHYTERYRLEDGAWRIAETKLTRLFRLGSLN